MIKIQMTFVPDIFGIVITLLATVNLIKHSRLTNDKSLFPQKQNVCAKLLNTRNVCLLKLSHSNLIHLLCVSVIFTEFHLELTIYLSSGIPEKQTPWNRKNTILLKYSTRHNEKSRDKIRETFVKVC